MNIENLLKPDAALIAAVENVKERERKLTAQFERRDNQKDVIVDLSNQLDELVTARRWESADAEDAKKAKHECADLTLKLEEEHELLNAISCSPRMRTVGTREARSRMASGGPSRHCWSRRSSCFASSTIRRLRPPARPIASVTWSSPLVCRSFSGAASLTRS